MWTAWLNAVILNFGYTLKSSGEIKNTPSNTWVPSLEILIYLTWGMTFDTSTSSQVILMYSQEEALLL